MAVSLLSREVSDLCLGKPPLRCLSAASATVSDAVSALKSSGEPFLSVWSCNHEDDGSECECVGKICMADVICHLSKDEKTLLSPSAALKAPVSVLLPETRALVVHVQPSCSLLEAIDLIIRGAQNLVVPIQTKSITKRRHQKLQSQNGAVSVTASVHKNGRQFCWITQEDIVRFLLGSIGLFSPLPSISIADLGIINSSSSVLAVDYSSSAAMAIPAISLALTEQTAVAVVDGAGDPKMALIGEISPMKLACCDESAAGALATLSAGDPACKGPPESLLRVVRNRLEDKWLVEMLSLMDSLSSTASGSSSDEESPARTASNRRSASSSAAIVCNPKSSLMAVMIQAIAHRVNYVWVIEKDCTLVGIVTFVDMLKVFGQFLGNTN
ncbi:PREDICTED: CBS domain-containing protein CBSX5-like [Tarenaya hassleriana]|uniref:CBS domain-containing protein CBSX5-like n=1 Tax=Tarenaya hassleriana TaxID=28532 RepID=UPI00053C0E90|nr:PREDICTED: CBS domain-containing protein CBSX5-like [Tarenaya hassleriana]